MNVTETKFALDVTHLPENRIFLDIFLRNPTIESVRPLEAVKGS